MLDANMKAQLAAYLERMTQSVEIVATLDDTPASADMRALLKDNA
jgi:alkyl hydroperoxide reductase subunit F